jgi:hypothetical protein
MVNTSIVCNTVNSRPVRRLLASVAAVAAVIAAVAGSASPARAQGLSLGGCPAPSASQPFAPWLDESSYELAPGGDFESGSWATAPWSLAGRAELVSGSEPYAATGTLGSQSLSLPAGAAAQSPLTCVDASYPTVRFFIAGQGTVAAGLVENGLYLPLGIATGSGSWAPTPVMLTDSAVLGLLSGGSAQVSVRLTALTGDPQVDDVFIDPWNRG